jgi:hypothetical protein
MDSYLSTQRSTIFQHVGVLIYVFEVGAHDAVKDATYYRDCLDALQKYSPEAAVFLLVHKIDLVTGDRAALLERRTRELQGESGTVPITVFGTSIYDETLYKVRRWSARSLLPSPLPPSPYTLRVSLLTSTGMVSDCALDHPKRGGPLKTPDDFRPSLQRYRGNPIRTNDLSRNRHLLPTR